MAMDAYKCQLSNFRPALRGHIRANKPGIRLTLRDYEKPESILWYKIQKIRPFEAQFNRNRLNLHVSYPTLLSVNPLYFHIMFI